MKIISTKGDIYHLDSKLLECYVSGVEQGKTIRDKEILPFLELVMELASRDVNSLNRRRSDLAILILQDLKLLWPDIYP